MKSRCEGKNDMTITAFRDVLDWLDREGLLARVSRPVDPTHELIAVLRKTQQGPNVALLFTEVRGSDLQVATNVLARRETIAQVLDLPRESVLAEMARRQGQSIPCELVSAAPVQQIRLRGSECDVTREVPQ